MKPVFLPTLNSALNIPHETGRAIVKAYKAKILTDTYMLQSNKVKFGIMQQFRHNLSFLSYWIHIFTRCPAFEHVEGIRRHHYGNKTTNRS